MKKVLSLVFVLAFLLTTALAFAGDWSGHVVKSPDGKLWLKVGEKNISIANPEKAAGLEGKDVKVTGSLNDAGDTVTIDSAAEAVAA